MIVGARFFGDNNKTLMNIQHDTYWRSLSYLFHPAKRRYLIAVNFLGVETELYKKIVGVQGFDHRVLQTAHDYIAAYYRYEVDPRGQIQFPFDNLTHEERLKNHWTKFLVNEGERLAENDEIAIAILESAGNENTKWGYAAEERLKFLIIHFYGEDFYLRLKEFQDYK